MGGADVVGGRHGGQRVNVVGCVWDTCPARVVAVAQQGSMVRRGPRQGHGGAWCSSACRRHWPSCAFLGSGRCQLTRWWDGDVVRVAQGLHRCAGGNVGRWTVLLTLLIPGLSRYVRLRHVTHSPGPQVPLDHRLLCAPRRPAESQSPLVAYPPTGPQPSPPMQ